MSEEAAETPRDVLSADWFRLLIESATDYGIFSLTTDAYVLTWNPGAEQLFLYPPSEIIGRHGDIIFTPEDRAAGVPAREFNTAMEEGRAQDDRWHLRSDGSRFWASGLMMSVRDDAGTIVGLLKIVQDKTEPRRIQEALRHSEEQFARLVLGNPAALMLEVRPSGRITMVNEAFVALTGFWRSELVGRQVGAIGCWPDEVQRAALHEALEGGGSPPPAFVKLHTRDAGVRECIATCKVLDHNGEQSVLTMFIEVPAERR